MRHTSLHSKTVWEKVLSVVGDYTKILPYYYYIYFKYTPNHLSWGVIFTAGLKGFLGELYCAWCIVCIFERILFSPRRKISCGTDLLMGPICWTISGSSPWVSKTPLAFVTFGDGSGCYSITIWWHLLGLSIIIIGIIIVLVISTPDEYYCHPYKLIWWCYLISLN